MIYPTIFLLSIFLFYVGDQERSGKLGVIPTFLGLLFPSILAGLRSTSVGTDTGSYVVYFERISEMTSLNEVFNDEYLGRVGLENGYRFLNFIVSRLTDNSRWMLGILAFLTILFVYLAARNYKDRYPIWLMMALYLFMHYSYNLNVARHGLANAMIFFGYRYLEDKKYGKYLIILILAFFIHNSAGIMGATLLLISIYLNREGVTWKSSIVVILAMVFVLVAYRSVGTIVSTFFPRFSGYVEDYGSTTPFSLAAIVIRIPFLCIAILYYRQAISVDEENYPRYFLLIIVELLVSQFGAMLGPFARLAMFFQYYKFLMVGDIYSSYIYIDDDSYEPVYSTNRNIFIILMFCALFAYWYFYSVLNFYGFSKPVYPFIMS